MKSISAEDTFMEDLDRGEELEEWLVQLTKSAFKRLQYYEVYGRTITLKVKFADFKITTKSQSAAAPVRELAEALILTKSLLDRVDFDSKKVRLLGVSFSNFGELKIRERYSNYQATLFTDNSF